MSLTCTKHNDKWIVHTQVHEKPGHIHTYPHRNSSLPHSTKTGFIRGELIRYIVLSSTVQSFLQQKTKFINRLIQWGYTEKFIRTDINHPNYKNRYKFIKSMINKKQSLYDDITNNKSNKYDEFQLFFVKRYDSRFDNHKLLREIFENDVYPQTTLGKYKIVFSNQVNPKLKHTIKPNFINGNDNNNNNNNILN